MMSIHLCPGCKRSNIFTFYRLDEVPVHSVVLLRTRDDALNYPRGDICLGFCQNCGLIINLSFNPLLMDYSSEYEGTQSCSPTFNSFHKGLAVNLIEQFNLHNKTIIEIGCGNGEFLRMLCKMGNNRGIGFDPSFVDENYQESKNLKIKFIRDYYSEKYNKYQGDFICCIMTLEHIFNPFEFIETVRHSIRNQKATTIFFQVPDVARILKERAFWDIYYEHCSYFDQVSLTDLFHMCGFSVLNVWKAYDDQYLMIECLPSNETQQPSSIKNALLETLNREILNFSNDCQISIIGWKNTIHAFNRNGQKIVLWGGGSKAVSFLTTLKIVDEIKFIVDINPKKWGTYIAGTGQEIVSPAFLEEYKPDVIIIMNNIYFNEIKGNLAMLNLIPKLMSI